MKINRLFEIVYILLENKKVTAGFLAEHFEITTRTVYRDIEMLSEAGIPVYMSKGKGGGISLMPDFILNKTVLTSKEKSDILSSLSAFEAVNLSKEENTSQKIKSILGDNNADWIEVDFSSWGVFGNDKIFFETLKNAILTKTTVTFNYANTKAEISKRKVYPLKMIFKSLSWYLYAYCTAKKAYRFFKLRRITDLTVCNENFTMASPEHVIDNSKQPDIPLIKAVYKINPHLSFRIYDEISSYTIDSDGNFICTVYMPDIDSICTYALSFGNYCTILSPQNAVDKIKEILKKSIENYF